MVRPYLDEIEASCKRAQADLIASRSLYPSEALGLTAGALAVLIAAVSSHVRLARVEIEIADQNRQTVQS